MTVKLYTMGNFKFKGNLIQRIGLRLLRGAVLSGTNQNENADGRSFEKVEIYVHDTPNVLLMYRD